MKIHLTPSIHARIALGLVAIFMTVLLAADLLFDLPSFHATTELKHREQVSYGLASAYMHLHNRGAPAAQTAALVASIANRDQDILSVAIRESTGQLRPLMGDHARHWLHTSQKESTLTHVRVPLLDKDAVWAHLEVAFRPAFEVSVFGISVPAAAPTMLVLGLVNAALVYLYLRRVLQHLDPGNTVPRRVREAFDVLEQGVLVLDLRLRVMMVNDALRSIAPAGATVVIGKPVEQLRWLTDVLAKDESGLPWHRALQSDTATAQQQVVIEEAPGTARHVVVEATPIRDAMGRTRGVLLTVTDVSALHRLNQQLTRSMDSLTESREKLKQQNLELKRLATRDPLTGCLNRRAFFELGEAAFAKAPDSTIVLGCIMIDIDHFKQFNDRYGHAVGDQVIKAVADVLDREARGTDLVCRYGGEEFCVLIYQQDNVSGELIAQRLRAEIEMSAAKDVHMIGDLRITASLGFAHRTVDVHRLQDLIDRADHAMYRSKRSGRNRVTCWTPDLATEEVG